MLKLTYSNIACLKMSRPPWWGREKGGVQKGMEREGEEERVGEEGEKGGRRGKGKKVPPSFRPSLRLCQGPSD